MQSEYKKKNKGMKYSNTTLITGGKKKVTLNIRKYCPTAD